MPQLLWNWNNLNLKLLLSTPLDVVSNRFITFLGDEKEMIRLLSHWLIASIIGDKHFFVNFAKDIMMHGANFFNFFCTSLHKVVAKGLHIMASLFSLEMLTGTMEFLKCNIYVIWSLVLDPFIARALKSTWFCRGLLCFISLENGDTLNCSQSLSMSCWTLPFSCFLAFSSQAWKCAFHSFISSNNCSLLY